MLHGIVAKHADHAGAAARTFISCYSKGWTQSADAFGSVHTGAVPKAKPGACLLQPKLAEILCFCCRRLVWEHAAKLSLLSLPFN